ncbi:hypothetical protein BLL52_2532 [Rhodoferax antarcticus ANT.BR]|uniref:Uncharacterized protein n=1 Tax=Rhodoferax antarcticus ANT.BR TaxID=1111071 RepID=A0A1Q8YE10_9BURK|nr:hypothetical protein BLL52_2532 [Rhodoferax antarcticus ANT.BR]
MLFSAELCFYRASQVLVTSVLGAPASLGTTLTKAIVLAKSHAPS